MVVQYASCGRVGGVVHKGSYGTASTGDGPTAGTGAAARTRGGPAPGARADQDGPHP